jgi:hypothetical protein
MSVSITILWAFRKSTGLRKLASGAAVSLLLVAALYMKNYINAL